MCATRLYYVFLVCTLGYYIKYSTITIDSHVRCSAINPGVQLYIIITWFTVTYCCRGMGAVRVEFRGVTPDFSGLPSPYVPGRGGATQKKRVSAHSFDQLTSHIMAAYIARFTEKVGNYFFPRARDGGSWLPGQRSEPADPDAGTARQPEIRVRGRSLSDSRPDDPSRCSALGG